MENKDATTLNIQLVEGDFAPRYKEGDIEVTIDKAVITEKGMQSELPLVDLQMTDKDGNVYFTALSGRLFNMLSSAIKGVNLRNHGTEEP